MHRRNFLQRLGGTLLLATTAAGCDKTTAQRDDDPTGIELLPPRLGPRVGAATLHLAAGYTRLRKESTDIVAYLPASALARQRVPLMVFLHGANKSIENIFSALQPAADAAGVMMVAPYSIGGTWDAIFSGFSGDIHGLDVMLQWVFGNVPIDASRIVLSGFSDGATYALGVGRANGDLFSRVIAFSPGFLLDVAPLMKPSCFISHATDDTVLSFAYTRDTIVPRLKNEGYTVDFRPFVGGHGVPVSLAEQQIALIGSTTPL